MRISDWSSDVCSSDLSDAHADAGRVAAHPRCLEAGRRGQALEAPGNRLSKQGLAQATVAMDPPEDRSRGNLRTLEPGVQSGAGPRRQPRAARLAAALGAQIGRATCRARGWQSG